MRAPRPPRRADLSVIEEEAEETGEVEEEDTAETGEEQVGEQAPQWGAQEWRDWDDWSKSTNSDEEDSSIFMQLGMSEEAELENLGLEDQARRDLRGLLRELRELDNLEEGPEGRWALREWLLRWRHILGVLQSLMEIMERRLSSNPACSFSCYSTTTYSDTADEDAWNDGEAMPYLHPGCRKLCQLPYPSSGSST